MECSRCLTHNDKHRIYAAILRERDHFIRQLLAIQGHLLYSLVDVARILHLKLIGCWSKPVSEAKASPSPGNAWIYLKPIRSFFQTQKSLQAQAVHPTARSGIPRPAALLLKSSAVEISPLVLIPYPLPPHKSQNRETDVGQSGGYVRRAQV